MKKIKQINFEKSTLNINPDFEAGEIEIKPGPPESFAGLNIGVATMENSPPHGGEIHHDGDELLYVLRGCINIKGDSSPDQDMFLNAGDSCLVKSGEWHRISVIEPAKILYMTPGPHNEHR